MRNGIFHTKFHDGKALYYLPIEERHNHIIGLTSIGNKIEINEHNQLISATEPRESLLKEFSRELSWLKYVETSAPYKACLYF